MGGNELNRAKRLFRRKKYSEVIRALEPQVFRFRDNPDFYYYLGSSYYFTGDIAGASTYIKRVVDLKKDHIPSMLLLALIYLHQNKNKDAIDTWLSILELESGNKYAKRGLELLKKDVENTHIVDDYLRSQKRYLLVPKKKKIFPFIVAAAVVLLFAIPFGLYQWQKGPFQKNGEKTGRIKEIDQIIIDKSDMLIDMEGSFTYILEEDQIIAMVEKAKAAFNKHEDNTVQKIINRIVNSNASKEIKSKVLMMEPYLKTPDFTNYKGDIQFEEVQNDPLLYEDCYVRWKGKISNLEIGESAIEFDFLVGYHDNQTLEGIIPVMFDFGIPQQQGDPVEIIGKIVKNGESTFIQGTSIRPIAPGERQ